MFLKSTLYNHISSKFLLLLHTLLHRWSCISIISKANYPAGYHWILRSYLAEAFSFFRSIFLSTGCRDNLQNELEKLRDEQRYMENDLSNIQIRWHTLREENVKAANTLRDVKKAEEELEHLMEEKGQLDLDEKVVCSSKNYFLWFYIIWLHGVRWSIGVMTIKK